MSHYLKLQVAVSRVACSCGGCGGRGGHGGHNNGVFGARVEARGVGASFIFKIEKGGTNIPKSVAKLKKGPPVLYFLQFF